MNWRPKTAEDLIGQAKRVALAQANKAKRLASDPSATMKLLLYGPPGVGKTSVVELVALAMSWPSVAKVWRVRPRVVAKLMRSEF